MITYMVIQCEGWKCVETERLRLNEDFPLLERIPLNWLLRAEIDPEDNGIEVRAYCSAQCAEDGANPCEDGQCECHRGSDQ